MPGRTVRPGHPDIVAITQQDISSYDSWTGVAVFDAGAPLPDQLVDYDSPNAIAFAGDILYGYSGESTAYSTWRMPLGASGITGANKYSGLISGFDSGLVGATGRLYADSGAIIDTTATPRLLGTLSMSGAIALGTTVFFAA